MVLLERIIIILFIYMKNSEGFSEILTDQSISKSQLLGFCELPGPKCKMTSDFKNGIYTPGKRPFIFYPETGRIIKPQNDIYSFDKDEKVNILCLGNKNYLSYSYEYPKVGFLKWNIQPEITCVCGNLFKHVCTVFDMEILECSRNHHGDLREIVDKNYDPFYQLKTQDIYFDMAVTRKQTIINIDGIIDLYIYNIIVPSEDDLSLCQVVNTVSWIKKSDTFIDKNVKVDPKNPSTVRNFCQHIYSNFHYNEHNQQIAMSIQLGYNNRIKPGSGYVLVPTYLTAPDTQKNMFGVLATDTDTNISPQWKIIKEGNWAITEAYVKNYWAKKFDLIVITGVYEYLTLEDDTNEIRDTVWLYYSGRDSEVPISKYFIKIVAQSDFSKGQVFVTVNNPYMNKDKIKTVVNDLCTWNSMWQKESSKAPRWDNSVIDSMISKGYSFCCYINDFYYKSQYIINNYKIANIKHMALDMSTTNQPPHYYLVL